MKLEHILLEKTQQVAIITIDHPPANTWSLAAMVDFENVLDAVESDADVRVIVLTGAGGKCFSAGFDVSDAANKHMVGPKGSALWTRVDRFPKPIIAAINGHALGGGLELALCCHFRIMADTPQAKVGLTELNLGIIPAWGGTQRLPGAIGKARALDMILFSKRLDANEALEIGLIHQVSRPEGLMDDAMTLAEALVKRPPLAVMSVLKAISAYEYQGLEEGLKVESEGSALVGASEDAVEGFTAFFEKREPIFKGK